MPNIINYQGNANQKHTEIPLYTHYNGYNKKRQIITSVGEIVEKLPMGM